MSSFVVHSLCCSEQAAWEYKKANKGGHALQLISKTRWLAYGCDLTLLIWDSLNCYHL